MTVKGVCRPCQLAFAIISCGGKCFHGDDICGKVVGLVGGADGARGPKGESGNDSSDSEDTIKPKRQ